MFITRKNTIRNVAPFALVGALVFTGCSASSEYAPAEDIAAVIEASDVIVGTGITSMEEVRWGVIDSDDPEFNAAVEELVLALNAASPGGLLEVNINAHGPNLVGINLLTDSEDGTISAAQVTAVLDTLAGWAPPAEVGKFEVGGFHHNFGTGEILTGAAEAGVNPEFLNEMYGKIVIPGDQLNSIYG